MAHTRIKATKSITDIPVSEVSGWHLVVESDSGADEYTACGLALDDFETKTEAVEKAGITCEDCLNIIRFYKSIKL